MIKADLKRFGASGAFLYLGGAAEARALLTAEADEIMPRPTTSVGISVGFTTCDTKCGRVETFEWVGLVVRMVVVAKVVIAKDQSPNYSADVKRSPIF